MELNDNSLIGVRTQVTYDPCKLGITTARSISTRLILHSQLLCDLNRNGTANGTTPESTSFCTTEAHQAPTRLCREAVQQVFQSVSNSSRWGKQVFENKKGPSTIEESSQTLFEGPETSESKLFTLGSNLATRLSTDREIQCTEFNETGEIVSGHGHIKKSDLVRKARIKFPNSKSGANAPPGSILYKHGI